jgi:hypothetical protein
MFHFLFVTVPLAIVLYVVGAIYLLQYLEQQRLLPRDKRIPLPRAKPDPESKSVPETSPDPTPAPPAERVEVVEATTVTEASEIPEPEVKTPLPQRDPLELGPHVPEDPILRRHFGGHIMTMIQELKTIPVPQEAVLRRHFQQEIEETFNACLHDELAYARLVYEYEQAFLK